MAVAQAAFQRIFLNDWTAEAAEKIQFLKGTAFRPYIIHLDEIRLQPLRGRFALDNAALRGLKPGVLGCNMYGLKPVPFKGQTFSAKLCNPQMT